MSIKLTSGNYQEVVFAPTDAILKDVFVPAATMGGTLNGFAGIANLASGIAGVVIVKADSAIATKVAADNLAFAAGEAVRYNVSGAKVSKTGSDPLIGYAKKAAIAADTSVDIMFDGALAAASGESITLAQITDLADLKLTALDDDGFTVTKAQVSDLNTVKLSDLADVNVEGVTDNDRLAYDLASTKWIAEAVTD